MTGVCSQMVQITRSQHWLLKWLGNNQPTNHYLKQGWPILLACTCLCITRPRWVNREAAIRGINQISISTIIMLYFSFWSQTLKKYFLKIWLAMARCCIIYKTMHYCREWRCVVIEWINSFLKSNCAHSRVENTGNRFTNDRKIVIHYTCKSYMIFIIHFHI